MFGSGCQQTSRPTQGQSGDPLQEGCPKPGPTRRFLPTPRGNSTAWQATAPTDCRSGSLHPWAKLGKLAIVTQGRSRVFGGHEGSRSIVTQLWVRREQGSPAPGIPGDQLHVGGPRKQLWAFPQSPRKWVPAGLLAKLQRSPQSFSLSAPALLSAQADVGETRFSPWEGSLPSLSWQPRQPAWICLPSFATPGLGWGKGPTEMSRDGVTFQSASPGWVCGIDK